MSDPTGLARIIMGTIVAIAQEEARPWAHLVDGEQTVPGGRGGKPNAAVYTAPGLSVRLARDGKEPRATVWIERTSVEAATAALYAYTRQN